MNLLLIPAIILLLAVLFLFVPFYISVHLDNASGSTCGIYRISWFGLTLYRGDLISPKNAEDDREVKTGNEPGQPKGENDENKDIKHNRLQLGDKRLPRDLRDIRMLIDAIPVFYCFLKDLTRSIRIDQLSCNLTFGLDDPADTAIWSGYLWSLAYAFPFPAVFRLEPYFYGERLEGSIDAEIRTRLYWAIVAVINAARKRPIRRLCKETIREKLIRNKASMNWLKISLGGRGH